MAYVCTNVPNGRCVHKCAKWLMCAQLSLMILGVFTSLSFLILQIFPSKLEAADSMFGVKTNYVLNSGGIVGPFPS